MASCYIYRPWLPDGFALFHQINGKTSIKEAIMPIKYVDGKKIHLPYPNPKKKQTVIKKKVLKPTRKKRV